MENNKGKVVLGLVEQDGKVLVIKRRFPEKPLLWALPGGVVEPSETEEQALAREIKTEVGVEVETKEKITERIHKTRRLILANRKKLRKSAGLRAKKL